jgi:holo-[acyl-carrier protein] synthase
VVLGVGIDIVEVERVGAVARRHGERFLRRVYTPLEVARSHGNPDQYLASRFAAKEAAFKALGTGWGGGVKWTEVEIDNLASGAPVMTLAGAAQARAARMGVARIHLTISHTAGHAMAQVLFEGPIEERMDDNGERIEERIEEAGAPNRVTTRGEIE